MINAGHTSNISLVKDGGASVLMIEYDFETRIYDKVDSLTIGLLERLVVRRVGGYVRRI